VNHAPGAVPPLDPELILTARRLIALGYTVLAGARDSQRGAKAAHELGATFIKIDPTDDGSVSSGVGSFQRVLDPGSVENLLWLSHYFG